MSKRDERLKRAAAARKALGLEDANERERVLEGDPPAPVPEPVSDGGGSDLQPAQVTVDPVEEQRPKGVSHRERPGVHQPIPVPLGLAPKRHEPGAIKRADSVWYRGERYFVEWAPANWVQGTHARISNRPVHSNTEFLLPSDEPTDDLVSFCVHLDCLDVAPPVQNIYGGAETMATVERKERAKQGLHDVGDEVANLLRDSKDIYRTGSEYLGVPEAELKRKYGHLNAGQQRMNIGNRMRSKWKKSHGGKR